MSRSLPFRTAERLLEIQKIEDQFKAGLLTPQRALSRLWGFFEDELRLWHESRQASPTVTDALAIGGRRRFFSAPRHFTRYSGAVDSQAYDRWRSAPGEAANVTVYLNANVAELKLAPDRERLQWLEIACLNGRRHSARGRSYVLATGGIENARLLLASNSVAPHGVGNDNDLVGRNFQGHVVFAVNQRANLVSAMSRLAKQVVATGEPVMYTGKVENMVVDMSDVSSEFIDYVLKEGRV